LERVREAKSAGFIIVRRTDALRFLILKHDGRLDFPKGLINEGEVPKVTALRELEEETGIKPSEVRIIDGFSRSVNYFYKWGEGTVHKEVIYFLAETDREDVRISDEHDSYAWMTGKEVASYVHYRDLRESIAEAESFLSSKSCVASPISQHTADL